MNIVDLTGVRALADDLGRAAGPATVAAVQAAVAKGALNVKNDAVRLISGHPRSRHYPASIGYDLEVNGGEISAEIGPDKGRTQGALGNILEYGTSKNAPIPHLNPALDIEEPGFADWVSEAAVRALW